MSTIYQEQFNVIKKDLKINKVLSIRFSNTKAANFKKYQDTVCTVLARSFKNNTCTYIDRKNGQPCSGGNYFLNITHPTQKEISNVYVEEEKVFCDQNICDSFIRQLPKYPFLAQRKYVLISPLTVENKKPDVIMLLVNPAQASRILGLSVYYKFSLPEIIPGLSTCASIYAPLASNKIHLNFIDYYDRYYQGKQKGKSLWLDTDLIVSMSFAIFEKIIKCLPLSSHGSYKTKMKPQKFDSMF